MTPMVVPAVSAHARTRVPTTHHSTATSDGSAIAAQIARRANSLIDRPTCGAITRRRAWSSNPRYTGMGCRLIFCARLTTLTPVAEWRGCCTLEIHTASAAPAGVRSVVRDGSWGTRIGGTPAATTL
jgi:hypothetical protein